MTSRITLKRPLDDKGLDHLEKVLNEYVKHLDRTIDWGEYEGRKRKPCPEQPLILIGMPLGQYHCPVCVEMQIAGLPHMPPDEHYERMTGHEWPAGYEDSNYEQHVRTGASTMCIADDADYPTSSRLTHESEHALEDAKFPGAADPASSPFPQPALQDEESGLFGVKTYPGKAGPADDERTIPE